MDTPLSTAALIRPDAFGRAAALIRCIGHPLRLRLLDALASGEKTVTELQGGARAPQPLVSQHLSVLKAHGVVDLRPAGPFAYYRITEPRVAAILTCLRAVGWGVGSPGTDDRGSQDA